MRFAITIGLSALLSLAQGTHPVAPGGSYLGVMMQEVDSERAKALKLNEGAGVEITLVEQDSPAEKAGLKVGDVVLRYNGQRVEGNEQFARMVHETPAGREVKIEINRGGTVETLTARVAQKKAPRMEWGVAPMQNIEIHMPEMPRMMPLRSSILGLDVESVDGQLAQYFGVKEGVLVRSVLRGSSAEKAGVRAGDVIMKIEDARVVTPSDLAARVRTLHGKSAPLLLMRDRKELTVPLTVSDDDPSRIQMTPFQINP
jgi:serine protease Do